MFEISLYEMRNLISTIIELSLPIAFAAIHQFRNVSAAIPLLIISCRATGVFASKFVYNFEKSNEAVRKLILPFLSFPPSKAAIIYYGIEK